MTTINKTKIHSIKIADALITITTDTTFKTLCSTQTQIEKLKSIHFHLDSEIFFINKGKLVVHTENEAHSFSDSLVLIPPFFLHYSEPNENNYRLQISINKNTHIKNSILFDKISAFFNSDKIIVSKLTPSMLFLLEELDRTFEDDLFAKNEREESILTLLFFHILDSFGLAMKEENDSNDDIDAYILQINNIICNELDEKINLQFVADRLHLSTKQTTRIIKKYYSCSLSDLLIQRKLSIACMLLTNTNLKISKIIKLINIETANYFFRLFKKAFGITPLQYRKNTTPPRLSR